MGWRPQPPSYALPFAGPLWFYAEWFRAPHKEIPISVFWFNHTLISTSQGPLTFVIPLTHNPRERADGLPSVSCWKERWLKTLSSAYGKAPFFDLLFPDINDLLGAYEATCSLAVLNAASHELWARWLMAGHLPPPCCSWYHGSAVETTDQMTLLRPSVLAGSSDYFVHLRPDLSIVDALMRYGREIRLLLCNNF